MLGFLKAVRPWVYQRVVLVDLEGVNTGKLALQALEPFFELRFRLWHSHQLLDTCVIVMVEGVLPDALVHVALLSERLKDLEEELLILEHPLELLGLEFTRVVDVLGLEVLDKLRL